MQATTEQHRSDTKSSPAFALPHCVSRASILSCAFRRRLPAGRRRRSGSAAASIPATRRARRGSAIALLRRGEAEQDGKDGAEVSGRECGECAGAGDLWPSTSGDWQAGPAPAARSSRGDRVQLRWKEAGGERQPPGAGGRRRGPLARPLLAARRAPASGRFGWGVWWLVGNQCRRCGVMNGTDASWCSSSQRLQNLVLLFPFPFCPVEQKLLCSFFRAF